jgi:Skp family chaperone for outer membrane proteins
VVRSLFCLFLFQQFLSGMDINAGVVDIQKVFMEYSMREELLNQLAAEKKSMEERIISLKKELSALQSDLDTMSPVSTSFEKTQMKLIEVDTKLKITTRQFEVQFERQKMQLRNLLLRNILKEINLFAREKELDIVFSKSTPSQNAKDAVEPLLVVLYNNPKLDITEAIIKRLNTKSK